MAKAPARPLVEVRRTWAVALMDALPDALALGACLLAWLAPTALRIDLVAWAAPLYFVEFPLALILLFGGVTRIEDPAMSRRSKLGFVLAPILVVALMAPMFLGPAGLVAVFALSARLLWRVASGRIDRSARVRGAWITYAEGDGAHEVDSGTVRMRVGGRRGRNAGGGRRWRVEASHELVMAALTLTFWVFIAMAFMLVTIPPGGITAEIAAASLWTRTVIGSIVPPQVALAAGATLFAARVLGHLEGIEPADAPPPVSVEDDPVLREIVDRIEGKDRKRRKPPQA
jgi:hypothetical protein